MRTAGRSGGTPTSPVASAMNELSIEPNDDYLLDKWWGDPPECPECDCYEFDCECEEE